MTRTFHEKYRCLACGAESTQQTDFERWMREHKSLESRDGIVRFDLDVLLHRYKFMRDGKSDRSIQCMMFIEIKTHMAELSDSQADTLWLLDQVLRNRRQNIHSKPRPQDGRAPREVFSKVLGRKIKLMLYGGHVLQLSGTHPDNSEKLMWDKKHQISTTELIELLRFGPIVRTI